MANERISAFLGWFRGIGQRLAGLLRRGKVEHRIGVVGPAGAVGKALIAEIQGRQEALPFDGSSFKYHDPATQIHWQLSSLDPESRDTPRCQLVLAWISYQDALVADTVAALALDNPQLLARGSKPAVKRVGLVIRDLPSGLPRDASQGSIPIRRVRSGQGVSGWILERIERAKGCPGDPLADSALASALSSLLETVAFSSLLEALYGHKHELTLFFASDRSGATEEIRRWISSGIRFRPKRPPLARFAVAAVFGLLALAAWFLQGGFPSHTGDLSGVGFDPAKAQFEQRWARWNGSWPGRLGGTIEMPLPGQVKPPVPEGDCSEPLEQQVEQMYAGALAAEGAAECTESIRSVADSWSRHRCGLEFASRFNEECLTTLVRCAVLSKAARDAPVGAGLPTEAALFGMDTAAEARAEIEALLARFERTAERGRVEALLASSDLRGFLALIDAPLLERLDLDLAPFSVSLDGLIESIEQMSFGDIRGRRNAVYSRYQAMRRFVRSHPGLLNSLDLERLGALVALARKAFEEKWAATIEIEPPPGTDGHVHLQDSTGVWGGARNLPSGSKLAVKAQLLFNESFAILVDRSSPVHFGPVPSSHDETISIELNDSHVTKDGFSFTVASGFPVWEPK